MGRYGFTSAGAAGSNAITEFLIQREMQKQQALIAAITQRNAEEDNKRASAELELRTGQERRMADAQRFEQEQKRNATPKRTVVDTVGPDGAPIQKAFTDDELTAGVRKYVPAVIAPSKTVTTIGPKGEPIMKSVTDDDLRQGVPTYVAPKDTSSRDMQNQLTQMRIDTERQKQAEATQSRTERTTATKSTRQQVRDLAQGLYDDPSLEAVSGAFDARMPTYRENSADVEKRMNQLIATLSLGERGKLKGQGQISDYEAKILANAVSALDLKAGSANVRKHLKEIIDSFQGDAPSQGPSTGGGSTFRVVGVR